MADKIEKKEVEIETASKVTTLLVEVDKKKRGKRRYSRGLRVPGELERTGTRVLHRLARSVEEGIGTWRSESEKSARKKRNGAFRRAPENFAEAASRTIRIASRVPVDAVKTLPRLRIRKVTRRIISTILG
jgi:hypothetical protein